MTPRTELTVREDWEVDGTRGVLIRINRPDLRNPLDHDTVRALLVHLDEAEADPLLRGFIVTGVGKAFSAGGDLRKYLDLYKNPARFSAFLEDFKKLCERLERGPLVTCAMVNGACVAGGLELALACDFITISQTARIGDGHLGSGQLPGAGGSQRLGRAIGWQKAKEWMLTGRLYTPAEAEAVGLTTLVSAPGELEAATISLVAAAGQHSPHAYRTMKQLIDVGRQNGLDDGLQKELATVHTYATTSHDALEGIQAFLEKRPPEYQGLPPAGNTAEADLQPRTQKGNRTRSLLKTSARNVFGRIGYGHARVSDITSEANLSQGSFYRYFTDKEAVLMELLEDLLRDVVAFARDSWLPTEPTRSVYTTTRKYLTFYEKNADLYAMLIEAAQREPRVREMWIQARDVFYHRIARMITRAQAEGLADPSLDAEFTATLFGGMTEQYAYACFVEGRPSSLSFDDVVTQMSRIWANAIFREDAVHAQQSEARQ
ncbi:enoyl-CoA hydratase-related protein [Planosporangium sp. 12N6]|uniref:enoyl-CoA hydratase-related protein n=1 Tax=Planosporangium spinosum TaxID=3402278 RepID=UPI003CF5EF0E